MESWYLVHSLGSLGGFNKAIVVETNEKFTLLRCTWICFLYIFAIQHFRDADGR